MNGLREKIRNKKGFTLVEMLIVVAIIAILIAVSIPLVGSALDRAKHSTDAANERAAKAEILLQYLAGDQAVVYDGGTAKDAAKLDTTQTYYYDAANGRLDLKSTSIASYAQCENGKHTGTSIIQLTITTSGEVTVSWTGTDTSLCSTAKDVKHSTT